MCERHGIDDEGSALATADVTAIAEGLKTRARIGFPDVAQVGAGGEEVKAYAIAFAGDLSLGLADDAEGFAGGRTFSDVDPVGPGTTAACLGRGAAIGTSTGIATHARVAPTNEQFEASGWWHQLGHIDHPAGAGPTRPVTTIPIEVVDRGPISPQGLHPQIATDIKVHDVQHAMPRRATTATTVALGSQSVGPIGTDDRGGPRGDQ